MSTTEQIRADIEVTRAELAETADALAARLNEKAQVAKRMATVLAGAAAGVSLLIVVVRRARK
jgi:hypothetical protein